MTFLALSPQPAAGAAGPGFSVRLPATSGKALLFFNLGSGRLLPPTGPAAPPAAQFGGLDQRRTRTQHRAQCRSLCLSKAGF